MKLRESKTATKKYHTLLSEHQEQRPVPGSSMVGVEVLGDGEEVCSSLAIFAIGSQNPPEVEVMIRVLRLDRCSSADARHALTTDEPLLTDSERPRPPSSHRTSQRP